VAADVTGPARHQNRHHRLPGRTAPKPVVWDTLAQNASFSLNRIPGRGAR
jgi:hypothetical protein